MQRMVVAVVVDMSVHLRIGLSWARTVWRVVVLLAFTL
jgi:hypothetical protein